MSLTPEQMARRDGKIGASFVPALMAGDERRLLQEWMRLVEHPDYAEEDFSADWPVQFGSYIEGFALDWHERKTGEALSRRGEWIAHPGFPHIGCTLDAYRRSDKCVVDVKAPGAWRKLDEVIAYYPGQLVVQKACTGAERAALLVVHGGSEPAEYAVTWDREYEGEVWERLSWFWQRVETLQPPVALPAAKAPVAALRSYDMSGRNEWAAYAANWLANSEAAACFNRAAKELKLMVPADAAKAFGHGIAINRSRAGALSIKELAQ